MLCGRVCEVRRSNWAPVPFRSTIAGTITGHDSGSPSSIVFRNPLRNRRPKSPCSAPLGHVFCSSRSRAHERDRAAKTAKSDDFSLGALPRRRSCILRFRSFRSGLCELCASARGIASGSSRLSRNTWITHGGAEQRRQVHPDVLCTVGCRSEELLRELD